MAKDSPSKRVSRNTERAEGEARKAYDEGQQVFIFEVGKSFRSATEGVAEAIGWRLEHVSHASSFSRSPGQPIGYYVFRRI
jgi:hypothetical protein